MAYRAKKYLGNCIEEIRVELIQGMIYKVEELKPSTVGELAEILEYCVEDIKEIDPSLKITSLRVHNGKIEYILEEGIVQ